MPRKGFERISREEILEALRRYVKEVEVSAGSGQGEKVTMKEFCRHLGISPSTLLERWGKWRDLRAAAGLKRPRAEHGVEFSDQALILEYRRVCEALGRPPTEAEFNQRAACRMITLYKRFGSLPAIRRRAEIQERYARVFGRETIEMGKPRLRWDEAWLRELLKRVRVGFALYSSDVRDRWTGAEPLPFDVLFCARHDWPGCPVPVLVAEVVLGERAFEGGAGAVCREETRAGARGRREGVRR